MHSSRLDYDYVAVEASLSRCVGHCQAPLGNNSLAESCRYYGELVRLCIPPETLRCYDVSIFQTATAPSALCPFTIIGYGLFLHELSSFSRAISPHNCNSFLACRTVGKREAEQGFSRGKRTAV